MEKLSSKQQHVLDFICQFLKEQRYPPTVRDIVKGCKISSTSVADYNLKVLEKSGFIHRQREVSRGIQLLNQPTLFAQREVPIIGQIAAGEPIPVPGSDTWNTAPMESIEVSEDLTQGKEGVYALRVKGTSMVDNLINDGDLVLMQYTNVIESGETAAVWLKAEKEVTLKKVYPERGRIRLQPANSNMKPIFTNPENIEIQGRVIAVIRQLV